MIPGFWPFWPIPLLGVRVPGHKWVNKKTIRWTMPTYRIKYGVYIYIYIYIYILYMYILYFIYNIIYITSYILYNTYNILYIVYYFVYIIYFYYMLYYIYYIYIVYYTLYIIYFIIYYIFFIIYYILFIYIVCLDIYTLNHLRILSWGHKIYGAPLVRTWWWSRSMSLSSRIRLSCWPSSGAHNSSGILISSCPCTLDAYLQI
jgi:hypothetical protein